MSQNAVKFTLGKKETPCPEHRVQEEIMKTSEKEKYIGDQIASKANSKDTIDARISRGHAVLTQMSVCIIK